MQKRTVGLLLIGSGGLAIVMWWIMGMLDVPGLRGLRLVLLLAALQAIIAGTTTLILLCVRRR
ncbi:hypothetical protein HTZ77_37140 [Nonomuraea sp. SMC257]|uniref:Uncharacterized protein n=1 Tax=Nonomuraea montanisoli TaxID=2741721 RepID=A0A7Y6IEV3_9ACTN|nr:hypothetical protein [Nonomuraea montanisoli]NUW36989.1 hypothetical protein [Nonomuraea montanisoli]